jgi:hypothetical protein
MAKQCGPSVRMVGKREIHTQTHTHKANSADDEWELEMIQTLILLGLIENEKNVWFLIKFCWRNREPSDGTGLLGVGYTRTTTRMMMMMPVLNDVHWRVAIVSVHFFPACTPF